MTRGEKAESLFREGYNCSQAVVMAFADKINLPPETVALLSSPFGGGMGRLREVCGTVSGMFIVAGFFDGYSSPEAKSEKAKLYSLVQTLADEFRKRNGSIICRELLGLTGNKFSPVPEERTEEYYKKRPCPELCRISADIAATVLGIDNRID